MFETSLLKNLPILVEANLLSALAEALTADHQVVLADDGVAIHADAASARASSVFLGVSVPQVVGHLRTTLNSAII